MIWLGEMCQPANLVCQLHARRHTTGHVCDGDVDPAGGAERRRGPAASHGGLGMEMGDCSDAGVGGVCKGLRRADRL